MAVEDRRVDCRSCREPFARFRTVVRDEKSPRSFRAASFSSWAWPQVRVRCSFMAMKESYRLCPAETFSNLCDPAGGHRLFQRKTVFFFFFTRLLVRFLCLFFARLTSLNLPASMKECTTGLTAALVMPSLLSTSNILSALATSSSSVLPFKIVLRFCADCFDNRAPSFSTVPQVVVGMVTRTAAEAASICANLLVVYCRRDSSLPLSTLNSAFRRRSLAGLPGSSRPWRPKPSKLTPQRRVVEVLPWRFFHPRMPAPSSPISS